MLETGVTIDGILDRLYTLDTEYRESLAHALMELNYVSDSPLNLSFGTEEQQKELTDLFKRNLKANELKEIVEFMNEEMLGDFQYDSFKNISSYYLDIANEYLKIENDLER